MKNPVYPTYLTAALFALGATALLIVLLTGCSAGGETQTSASAAVSDIYGDEYDLAALSDYSLTMVNIWATWCSPCLRELPDLGELADEYAERGVQLVGIVYDTLDARTGLADDAMMTLARTISAETGADYPMQVPSDILVPDVLGALTAFPTTCFLDSEGNLVGDIVIGSKSKENWVKIIDDRLAQVSE